MTAFRAPRPLKPSDPVEQFACGDVALDDWFWNRAQRNETDGASRTYVSLADDGTVAGYYCLSAAAIARADTSGKTRRNMPDPIPAFLLGRLAVDDRFQGQRVGSNLLRDAIRRSLAAADIIGARLLLVHAASDRARSFYEAAGFTASPTDPMHLLVTFPDVRRAQRH